jgi:hypothetical protein
MEIEKKSMNMLIMLKNTQRLFIPEKFRDSFKNEFE